MSDDAFYEELLNFQSKPNLEKRSSNSKGWDYFNNLFTQPSPAQVKKQPKKQEFQHEYLKMLEEKSNKAKEKINQINVEKNMTKDQIRHRRNVQKLQEDLLKTKKEGKKYGPTVIDVFADDKTKDTSKKNLSVEGKLRKINVGGTEKQSQNKVIKPQEKKNSRPEVNRPQFQNRPLKKEQKQDKIIEKSRQKVQTKKDQSASGSSSSGSSSSQRSQGSEGSQDWRKELRQVTRYIPNDPKYKKRDRQRIEEAGAGQIYKEDRISAKLGRREEEEDFRREMAEKISKKHKKQ